MADKANPKVNVYGLGTRGVNLTKSPLHLDDNELTQAQNAEPNLDEREGGLRKRGGLSAFTSALNSGSSILGMANVPLLSTFTRTMYAALKTQGANTWLTSTDGTTWAAGTSPARAATWAGLLITVNYFNTRIQPFKNALIYPGDDYVVYNNANYTDPPLRAYYDNTADAELIRINVGPGATAGASPYIITDMVVVDETLYFATFEVGGSAPNHKGRVISLNLTTGVIKQIGNAFGNGTTEVSGGLPWTLCSYRGQLYCGLHGIGGSSAGKVVRITPTADTTWTTDVTGLQGYPICFCVFNGDLFAGLQGDTGETALVVRRAAGTGTWSTSDTGPGGTTGIKTYSILIVQGTSLFAVFQQTADDVLLVREFDGSSWSTDLDASSLTIAGPPDLGAVAPGNAVLFSGDLYVAFQANGVAALDGFILKRTSGGVWSVVTDGKNLRGYLAVTTVRS